MQVTVKFNADKNTYEAMSGKRVLCRAQQVSKLAEKVKAKFGVSISTESDAPAAAPAARSEMKSLFTVAERFDFIEKFVGMIAKKAIPSMIVTGNGGIGKTHSVTQTLIRLGKTEMGYGMDYNFDYDWLTIKGFSTPKALYRTLFEQNGKVIVFDDCDSVFKDPIASNILKGALDSSEKRIISWGSEMRDEDLPNSFEFTGQVIFISNLTLAKFPQALLSRSVKVDLTLDTDELVDRIEMILNETSDDADDVIEFVRANATKFTDLNVRSALTIKKIRDAMGEGWEKMALYQAMA